MRESKYRAWIKNANKMVDVIAIDLEKEEICWIFDDYVNWEQERVWIGFDDIALMQYTGLKDKNGKEIYEGDIVLLPQHNHSGRVFLNVNHGWVVEGICMSVKVHNYKNIEVIGNIYENPELYKEREDES